MLDTRSAILQILLRHHLRIRHLTGRRLVQQMRKLHSRAFIISKRPEFGCLFPESFVALHGLFVSFGFPAVVAAGEFAVIFLPSVLVLTQVFNFRNARLYAVQALIEA